MALTPAEVRAALEYEMGELELETVFRVLQYEPSTVYPKLKDEALIDLDAFRDDCLEVASLAAMLADKTITYEEAILGAAEELLSPVGLRGLKEALDDGRAPLSHEIVATYMQCDEEIKRPARFEIELVMTEAEQEDRGPVVLAVQTILLPETFDIVQLEHETTEAFVQRTVRVLMRVSEARGFIVGRFAPIQQLRPYRPDLGDNLEGLATASTSSDDSL